MLRTLPKKSLVLLLLLAASASIAFAHTNPVSFEPAKSATVSAPTAVTIHFTGAMEPKFSSITVENATGHVVLKEASSVSGADSKTMSVPLPTLPAGVYTVHWVATSVDSHRSQGEYTFTVK